MYAAATSVSQVMLTTRLVAEVTSVFVVARPVLWSRCGLQFA